MSTRNRALFQEVDLANTFIKRFKGWMGKSNVSDGEGLLLLPCKSVHTCFMRFNIDVLFIDSAGKVVHMIEQMKPWRFSPVVKKAAAVLEITGGSIATQGIKLGDQIIEL
jgi:uncharacterized membrane protein (UPF0127 family)